MLRALFGTLALSLVAFAASPQTRQLTADNRTVLGGGNELLAAGASAILSGFYDDGIRLTERGLERLVSDSDRAAALSNICAALAAKQDLELAIDRCTQSIALNDRNWRAYSNRSYAFYLQGKYRQANRDLRIAAAINPQAREVAKIRGMVNERNLQPSVIVEEHQ